MLFIEQSHKEQWDFQASGFSVNRGKRPRLVVACLDSALHKMKTFVEHSSESRLKWTAQLTSSSPVSNHKRFLMRVEQNRVIVLMQLAFTSFVSESTRRRRSTARSRDWQRNQATNELRLWLARRTLQSCQILNHCLIICLNILISIYKSGKQIVFQIIQK